jgi:hypothetical protein
MGMTFSIQQHKRGKFSNVPGQDIGLDPDGNWEMSGIAKFHTNKESQVIFFRYSAHNKNME